MDDCFAVSRVIGMSAGEQIVKQVAHFLLVQWGIVIQRCRLREREGYAFPHFIPD